MKIEFIPVSKEAKLLVPPPMPAKKYIPDWYKNIKNEKELNILDNGKVDDSETSGIKRCIPFLDGFTSGYIQETWTDIYIKDLGEEGVKIAFPQGPTIIDTRQRVSIKISNIYHPTEFIWKSQWTPKLPKGYSALFITPQNRLDLPFTCSAGIIDADNFYGLPKNGGNYPFFIQKGFNGIIPVGTPMYQIIPFKRENWKSVVSEFNEDLIYKSLHSVARYFMNGYKKVHWQRKSYE